MEIEVGTPSDHIVPQTQVLSGPDRLVVDFPNAIPGNQLHSQSVDRGDVKSVRVGLYQSKPPVTRLVVDLKSARSYQIFPSGRTVMIKVMGGASASDDAAVANVPPKRAALVRRLHTRRAGNRCRLRMLHERRSKSPLEWILEHRRQQGHVGSRLRGAAAHRRRHLPFQRERSRNTWSPSWGPGLRRKSSAPAEWVQFQFPHFERA